VTETPPFQAEVTRCRIRFFGDAQASQLNNEAFEVVAPTLAGATAGGAIGVFVAFMVVRLSRNRLPKSDIGLGV
jgi:hypothetical protein